MNNFKNVKDEIKQAVGKLKLKDHLDTNVLYAICLEPSGLPAISAHTMLPTLMSSNHETYEPDYLKSINRLLAKNYIISSCRDNVEYFNADYVALGIKQEIIDKLKRIDELNLALNNLGNPHLPNATNTLKEIFITETSKL